MGLRRSTLAAVALPRGRVDGRSGGSKRPRIDAPDQLIGVWQLNAAKSRYFPGPPPTSETRTYSRAGDSVVGVIRRAFKDGRSDRIAHGRLRPRVSGDGHRRLRPRGAEAHRRAHVRSRAVARRTRLRRRASSHRRRRAQHDDRPARERRGRRSTTSRSTTASTRLRASRSDRRRPASARPMIGARILAAIALVAVASLPLSAQWLRYPTPGTPRLADGKPNLSAPAPRAADGTRICRASGRSSATGSCRPTAASDPSTSTTSASIFPAARPFCRGRRRCTTSGRRCSASARPREQCLPHGIPDAMLTRTLPFKIVQTPGVTIILFEEFNNWRQVFTDGRAAAGGSRSRHGSATRSGRWEGDDVRHRDRRASTTSRGSTPAARRTPRRCAPPSGFAAIDFGHMDIEFSFDDPKTFTRPWSTTVKFNPAARHRPAGESLRQQQVGG